MGSRHANEGSKKSRGRPPTYVWAEHEVLTDSEKRLKISIEKRRERQKKSYYKKKNEKARANTHSSQHPPAVPDYIYDDFIPSSHSHSHSNSHSHSHSHSQSKRSNHHHHHSPLVVVREYYGP